MKKQILLIACLLFSVFPLSSACAADKKVHLSIKEALNSPEAKEKLGGKIRYYFGNQKPPAIRSTLREDVANKKANAFAKADEDACQRAFLSAMISLESRANEIGANAVVGIVSYFKKSTYTSNTHYECHVGNLMAGVALKGKFVKTAGK